jgi:hypothetical protein
MPLLASNFTSNSLQGTVVVSGGWANIDLQVDAFAFEGDKSFTVKLRKDSTTGQVIGTSNTIAIYDYSGIVSLTANTATVNEGNLVGFTLTTTNVANYTNVFYSVLPVTSNVTLGDFVANTGVVTIINNVGTFALRANSDLSLMDETGETFKLQVRTNSPTGNIVYVSSNVAIADVSKGFNIISFVENSSSVAEGGTLALTFNATNIPVGTLLYYSTDGNATTSTFTGGNTGSFVMNGLSNTVTLLPTAVPYGITQNFTVQIRRDSLTGTVLATSNNIIAIDSSMAYMTATGGTIVDSGGYRTHAFTTSGNLTISVLGASPTQNLLDYLVVAGGGGGGAGGSNFGNPYQYSGGGGGGAGGLLTSNVVITTTGNTVILVGSGGIGKGAYGPLAGGYTPGTSGSNTSVAFASGPSLIAFGGGGGSGGDFNLPVGSTNGTGRPGGSGGGTTAFNNYSPAPPAGSGTPGQGYPGGKSSPLNFGGVQSTGAGGGGGGAGEAGHYQPTDPVSPLSATTQAGGNGLAIPWAPPAYGTSGPAPGRWFAGGGGGGGWPGGSAYLLGGGAGGGGAGGFYPPGYPTSAFNSGAAISAQDSGANATINTGGGGGGVGSAGAATAYGVGGRGASGIVLIRYPYVAPATISNVVTTSNVFSVGSNITFTINALNANAQTLYYSTDGNVIASNFIGGNTGSFVANASGGIVTLQANTNIPLNESRSFRLQIRQDSTTGFISGSSANVTIDGFASQISATGGTITTAGGYRTHTFLTSNNFVLSKKSTDNIEYLIVAGGGSGGPSYGGGGGAGGMLYGNLTYQQISSGTYSIVVGAGGTSAINGSNSSGLGILSIGGGAGGNYSPVNSPVAQAAARAKNGGSGGGGHSGYNGYQDMPGTPSATNAGWAGGRGVVGQGFAGGDRLAPIGNEGGGYEGAGGGGAGSIGANVSVRSEKGGNGGIGLQWVNGTYYAGGGGGWGYQSPTADAPTYSNTPYTQSLGLGGLGGGGNGTKYYPGAPTIFFNSTSGTVNTGGGGGGADSGSIANTSGGSGIVIIRYPYS